MDGDKKKSVASASDLSLPAPTKEEKPALPNATPTSDCSTLKSSSDSRLSSDRDETSTPPKESAPRMTVRLLRDRSARPSGPVLRTRSSSSEVSEAADQLQGHLTRESPFVTPPHSGRVLPSPAVPPTTPDSKVKESHELVLPPLPLGLRPLSPEPRNVLLNAPRKPKRPVPLSNSNAADASPSSNSPKTTPPTGRCSPKRCARRALKFD